MNLYSRKTPMPPQISYFGNNQYLYYIREGLELIVGDFCLNKQKTFPFQTNDEYCEFVFVLSGKYKNNLEGTKGFQIKSLFSGLWLTPRLKGFHDCYPGRVIKYVCIRIKKTLLKEISGSFIDETPLEMRLALENKKDRFYFHASQMTFSMQSSVRQIFNCGLKGPMKRLFLEAKALELISDFLVTSFGRDDDSKICLPHEEKIKILKAKDILLKRMQTPPSLAELAKMTGLSETKLKTGFKIFFNKTVFRYLRDKRMEKARLLLESGDCNVTQAGYILGYSSPSHFTKVFTSYFGNSPKKYLIASRCEMKR